MKILVVAGEASADLHAGHFFEKLRQDKKLFLFGIGGEHLVSLGMEPIISAADMAVVGLTEAISKVPQTLRLIRELEILAEKHRPDFAFLVDLPDFNLRLAPRLKSLGIPVVYFVSPQVWAWRSKRVHAMAKCIDRLLCILPFEKKWHAEHSPKNLKVEYVGHPAIEEIPDAPYSPDRDQIAILPGSRIREVRTLFPEMIVAAARLKQDHPRLKFVVPLASILRANKEIQAFISPESSDERVAKALRALGNDFSIRETTAYSVLRHSYFALVASGTATLETALVGTPMLVTYKVSGLSAFLFRRFVSYRGPVAMANILHCGFDPKKRLVPELLQEAVTEENIYRAAKAILEDPAAWKHQAETLAGTRSLLKSGVGSPTENVLRVLREFG